MESHDQCPEGDDNKIKMADIVLGFPRFSL